jgi:predicted RNA-binding Zn-ribbon protein involved in translation (DUF1610 family)
MPATKPCPSCSSPIEIDPEQIGSSVACPQCGKSLTITRKGAGGQSADAASPGQASENVVVSAASPQTDQWQYHVKAIAVSLAALLRISFAAFLRLCSAVIADIQHWRHNRSARATETPSAATDTIPSPTNPPSSESVTETEFKCPHCGKALKYDPTKIGKFLHCVFCKKYLLMPTSPGGAATKLSRWQFARKSTQPIWQEIRTDFKNGWAKKNKKQKDGITWGCGCLVMGMITLLFLVVPNLHLGPKSKEYRDGYEKGRSTILPEYATKSLTVGERHGLIELYNEQKNEYTSLHFKYGDDDPMVQAQEGFVYGMRDRLGEIGVSVPAP